MLENTNKARLRGALIPSLAVALAVLLVGCGTSATATLPPAPTSTGGSATGPDASPTPASTSTPAQGLLAPTSTPSTEPSTSTPEPTEPAPSGPGQVLGVTYVVGEGSEATFTVEEKLARLPLPNDAVVRTMALSGEVHLDGQPSVINIDLHQLASDQERRDRYIREKMFPNNPILTFTVKDLGQLPEPVPVGEVITRQVSGEVSIRGVTKPLTFDVEARLDPDTLFILGRTTFTWDDLEIPPPNIAGRIQVQDEVEVQVLLAAKPTQDSGG